MTDFLTAAEVEAVRAPSAQSSWLPARCYTDPAFYDIEQDRVLARSWLAVGLAQQVAEIGDYFTVDVLDEPIIIVRDKDGEVRALSNVCPHRWMRVVGHEPDAPLSLRSDSEGTTKVFQCPYHLWSFDVNGAMIGAPGMEEAEDFDKADWCLPRIRAEVWGGLVFVNLDPDAAPLAPQLAALEPLAAEYELDRLVWKGEPLEYDCDWNWKLSVEAGSESYHHLALHRDILEDFLPAAMSAIEPSAGPFALYRNPTVDGSPMSRTVTPPAGMSEQNRCALTLLTIFPYTMLFMLPTHTAYLQVIPQGHDRHRLRYFSLFHPNSFELDDVDEHVAGVQAGLDAVHQQDMVAGRHMAKGVRSRFARPGRRSHLEAQLHQFHNWLLDTLET